ncbi:alkaline phosphatase family protein [Sphingobacterium sp. FBM7-1]|uniref:alkaline phosphatase family protein n=1 Tax=Sphingobacterium sp. FBM7-1 TaxID=2886688 RepID=UPI0021D4279F|nr:alkaline phosphatase family protein [Sphingobacterium sp. FBM7-1]
MWKSFFTGVLTVAVAFQVYAQPARPKLVVGLMIDQMRWDYLYRFANRYGDNGFKRILNDGFSCENTLLNYIPTFTAIGHSSVYTGSVPSIHGIAGNDWIIQATGQPMYLHKMTTYKE